MAKNREQKQIYEPLKKATLGRLHMKRVENSVGEAMPDTICINRWGTVIWVENKCLDDWPARATTLPLKRSFEKGQLGFARQWNDWKGHSFVLLRVAKEYMLLNPKEDLQNMTTAAICAKAVIVSGDVYAIANFLEKLGQ